MKWRVEYGDGRVLTFETDEISPANVFRLIDKAFHIIWWNGRSVLALFTDGVTDGVTDGGIDG